MRFKKITLLYLSVILYLFSMVSFSYAYFIKQQTVSIEIENGDVSSSLILMLNDIEMDETSLYYDETHHAYQLSITDIEAFHHISNFQTFFNIDTDIPVKIRFKILESYVITRTYLTQDGSPMDPYTRVVNISQHSEDFYPNSLFKIGLDETLLYGQDGYFYIKDTYQKGSHHLLIIDGGLTYFAQYHQTFEETGYVLFHIIIEVVQANRYQAFWDIDPHFYED